ncbi:MAG TPA: DNA replication/repair protein RecF [Armatimonadota bacterium]|nr:DNA replication/repair protein RecF [Armatimonadota bacterium]
MKLERLQLRDFRNYRELELLLDDPWVLVIGANAQGKSNLLEAIALACAGRSPRAAADVEMIRWGQEQARVAARVATAARGTLEMEAILASQARRQVKINGSPRRAGDLVGLVGLVLFAVDDLDVVKRDPFARRRFLDTELGALSKSYYWNLTRYRRVVDQRNRLLKDIRDRARARGELETWDQQLTHTGAVVVEKRAAFLRAVSAPAAAAHRRLAGSDATLELRYLPALGEDGAWARIATAAETPELRRHIAERLARALAQGRAEEIERGMTLCGPQRDDFEIIAGGVDLHRFGSQGEQRTAAIALRLGLVRVVAEGVGEPPLLLLDDVLSELDAERRAGLFEALGGAGQTIVTTTDVDSIPAGVRATARRLRVGDGRVVAA